MLRSTVGQEQQDLIRDYRVVQDATLTSKKQHQTCLNTTKSLLPCFLLCCITFLHYLLLILDDLTFHHLCSCFFRSVHFSHVFSSSSTLVLSVRFEKVTVEATIGEERTRCYSKLHHECEKLHVLNHTDSRSARKGETKDSSRERLSSSFAYPALAGATCEIG